MSIPKINLSKLNQPDTSGSSATEKSDSTEVTEESSHDSSQEGKTSIKPSMSSSTQQPVKNPLGSHRDIENSTPPIVSPRSAPPSDAPPPLPKVPTKVPTLKINLPSSTSTSSKAPTSTSAQPSTSNSTSSASSTSNKVIVFDLPNPKVIMKPAELAKLLIGAESMKYTNCLDGQRVDTILRSNTKVASSSESSAMPVSINETYLAPFMNKYFETSGVIKMQNSIVENYTKQSDKIHALYNQMGDGNRFARSDEAAALMKPLIAPVVDFICGKDTSLESTGLPKPVLELMLAVDNEVITWFKKNGSGNPDDLQTARINAMISFFGTRSFMGTWTVELSTDKSKPAGFYRPLIAYLNTYLNLQVKSFANKLVGTTPEQKKIISKQAAIFESRSAPAVKKKDANEENPVEKLVPAEKTGKKGGFLNLFNKEKTSELHSPRGKKETEVLHSPRRQLQRGATLQENASRDTTRVANRKKFIKEFIKEFIANYGLKEKDYVQFLYSLQNSVVEMSREEYKALKDDPLSTCISYLNTYLSRLITREETPQPGTDALWLLKAKLNQAKLAEEDS